MKLPYLLICLIACLPSISVGAQQRGKLPVTTDAGFERYKTAFLERLWRQEPDWATSVGYHNYDSVLVIPGTEERTRLLRFTQLELELLTRFEPKLLSTGNRIDQELILNQLKLMAWNITGLKEYEWNPSVYNVCGSFAIILSEHYAPLEERLRRLSRKLAGVPAYYAAAKAAVRNPVPELTGLAIDQNEGGAATFESDLPDSIRASRLPAKEQQELLARAGAAAKAVHDYASWLKVLKNDHPRSFRLGKKLYEEKFAFHIQASSPAAVIYAAAVDRKREIHAAMARLSRELWPKYFGKAPLPPDELSMVRRVIDTLSAQHVKPEEFQPAIERQLPELVAFINAKQLLYLDPSKPLIVRREPAYMAGVAGASVSSPGPYDKDGNTYYNVGSLEGWEPDRAENYLREYNHHILQILNIHEAIPGHYTQMVYANRSPDLIKSLLGNGAMIEGWAVYTEQMMLENGYGGNTPEMWLMWYKWNLRTVCNTILDYSVHTGNMTKEEAIALLTREAFQQQAEAEGKWKRVTVTSVQLTSYFTGYHEIIALRDELMKKQGAQFRLKTFHEAFLSYGSVPVKYIRELMLHQQGG